VDAETKEMLQRLANLLDHIIAELPGDQSHLQSILADIGQDLAGTDRESPGYTLVIEECAILCDSCGYGIDEEEDYLRDGKWYCYTCFYDVQLGDERFEQGWP
jgi:hypothetical protein